MNPGTVFLRLHVMQNAIQDKPVSFNMKQILHINIIMLCSAQLSGYNRIQSKHTCLLDIFKSLDIEGIHCQTLSFLHMLEIIQ